MERRLKTVERSGLLHGIVLVAPRILLCHELSRFNEGSCRLKHLRLPPHRNHFWEIFNNSSLLGHTEAGSSPRAWASGSESGSVLPGSETLDSHRFLLKLFRKHSKIQLNCRNRVGTETSMLESSLQKGAFTETERVTSVRNCYDIFVTTLPVHFPLPIGCFLSNSFLKRLLEVLLFL